MARGMSGNLWEGRRRVSKKKDQPWNKKGIEGTWDAIVIGSGMGGMTTAAMLAKMGKRVLVIEQHYVPGGFTHMFKRPGYIWDVGVHAVGEVTEKSMTGRLLSYLTNGKLKWASLGKNYDEFYFPDDFRIDFPDSPQAFRDNLIEAFPDEVEAIDGYLSLIKQVAGGMKSYYLSRALPRLVSPLAERFMAKQAQEHLEWNTKEVVEKLTDNPKLQAVFTAQWGYYGSVPSRSSFAIQALVVKHFIYGAFYPEGGAKEIALHLLQTVADAGGWTRISTSVEEIMIEKGRAVGVRLKGGDEIRAQTIVSAAGVAATARRLLPAQYRDARWVKGVEDLSQANAHICLYIGFKGDIRKAGAGSANKWFYDTWSCEVDVWDVHIEQEELGKAAILYCSFPSLKDPHHDAGPEERHTGEVVTFVPWEAFTRWRETPWKKRGEAYEDFKKRMEASLLEQFLCKMPELRPMVDYVELSTPLSTDNFCRPIRGSIYGLEPTPQRFKNPDLRPQSPIPGLYFSGSEVATVGVIGAMMGGVLATMAAEPIATAKMIRSI